MARMVLSFGACPVCDRHVPRTIQLAAGLEKEIFHCKEHGRLAYGPHSVPLHQMQAHAAEMTEMAQPLTGIELVH